MTSLLSDKTQLSQLATSLNSALQLAQEAGLNLAAIASSLEEGKLSELNAQLRAHTELTQQLLRLPAGSSAVVTNGRAVVVESPALGLSDDFSKEDFALLVRPSRVNGTRCKKNLSADLAVTFCWILLQIAAQRNAHDGAKRAERALQHTAS